MYKKIGGRWYVVYNSTHWYGNFEPPKCYGCDLMGINDKCMISGGLPECNEDSNVLYKKHNRRSLL
jgi:hypothetical protein